MDTTERDMALDDRMAKMESDLTHVQADIGELKSDIRDIRTDIKGVYTELHGFKIEVAKEFGSIRTSIEQSKLWMLVTALSAVVVPTVTTLAHAFKWF